MSKSANNSNCRESVVRARRCNSDKSESGEKVSQQCRLVLSADAVVSLFDRRSWACDPGRAHLGVAVGKFRAGEELGPGVR